MTKHGRRALYCLALFASLLAGCVVVPPPQPQQRPLPPPPAPSSAYDDIRRCRADNQQAHAEVLEAYEAARRAGRIDPAELEQFNAMEARLRNERIELARDGLSLQECLQIGASIARERNEVARMTRSDPAVARCMADNRQAYQELVALVDNTRRSGRIDPGEAQQLNAMQVRLVNLRMEFGRDGMSLPECQRIGDVLARDRNEVVRMTRSDPAAARCMADNRQAHQELLGLYENARRSGRINPAEAQQFNAMEARLANLRLELARDGISLQDCQRIGGAIARERDELARMTRFDPAAARCMAESRQAHQEVLGLYESARRSSRIDPGEAQRFNAIDARLQALRAELGRDGVSLQDCQRIAAAIARERDEVSRMAQRERGVGRCVADNRRAHADVYMVYNNASRDGRIDVTEALRFQAIDKRLRAYQSELGRDGLSVAECQRIGGAIAKERALVDEMAR